MPISLIFTIFLTHLFSYIEKLIMEMEEPYTPEKEVREKAKVIFELCTLIMNSGFKIDKYPFDIEKVVEDTFVLIKPDYKFYRINEPNRPQTVS